MFSFVLLDQSVEPSRIIAARDPIGITTLYQGWNSSLPGSVYFASELKCLIDECDKIISFPPGHVYDSKNDKTERYFYPTWWKGDFDGPDGTIPTNPTDYAHIRATLEAAVRKRLMSEVPYGVLLSGGLDSSLIAAIATRETEKVSQAQLEVRMKKLKEGINGPSSPVADDLIEEGEFRQTIEESRGLIDFSDPYGLASIALFFHWPRKFSRLVSREESRRLSGYGTPRIRFHGSGGTGCSSGSHLSSRNL